jgi:hypothetical protein
MGKWMGNSTSPLADVVLVLADDRRIAVVEDVVQQQHGSLLGRQALEQHEHRRRERVGTLHVSGRIVAAVGDDRLRQPLADGALAARAPTAARLIANRVVTVATNARGDAI